MSRDAATGLRGQEAEGDYGTERVVQRGNGLRKRRGKWARMRLCEGWKRTRGCDDYRSASRRWRRVRVPISNISQPRRWLDERMGKTISGAVCPRRFQVVSEEMGIGDEESGSGWQQASSGGADRGRAEGCAALLWEESVGVCGFPGTRWDWLGRPQCAVAVAERARLSYTVCCYRCCCRRLSGGGEQRAAGWRMEESAATGWREGWVTEGGRAAISERWTTRTLGGALHRQA